MHESWIAGRMRSIEISGIRKVFDLGKALKNPVNLSIGQPHFDVPEPVKQAAYQAIRDGRNGYTVTQGIAELRDRLLADVHKAYPGQDRDLLVTSGTSGGLVLALACTLNTGDEVIYFDPYFVMYPNIVALLGGVSVPVETYPDFQIDVDKVKAAITPRTKVIIANNPANPTGAVHPRATLRELARLARERNLILFSDEIYRGYCYDQSFYSPAEENYDTLVFDGFSKSHCMTGWRLGFVHGPRRLVEEMIKVQQFTFVCAPSIVQHAGLAALDCPVHGIVEDYRRKRDRLYEGLKDRFEIAKPGGAFYMFPKAPWGSGTEFATEAIHHNLLMIPGGVFSKRDTHFRLSYAASDATLEQGIEILNRLARRGA
jgi:aspartate aminotransferase/aminotransferase